MVLHESRRKIHLSTDSIAARISHAGRVHITFATPNLKRQYVIAIGLFSAVFIGSAIFGLIDIDGSYVEWRRLGYPLWTFYALTAGKVLGIGAVISNRSGRLKQFAFAGFLYDLLLALGSHIEQKESKVVLPLAGLAVWAFAYFTDKRVSEESFR